MGELVRTWLFQSFRKAAWAPSSVLVFYAVAAKGCDAYIRWPNLDIPTHFFGGAAIAYFFAVAIEHGEPLFGSVPRGVRLALALGLTAIAAIGWELMEFLSDQWLGSRMNLGVTDTLSDLFFGVSGGFVTIVVLARGGRRRNRMS